MPRITTPTRSSNRPMPVRSFIRDERGDGCRSPQGSLLAEMAREGRTGEECLNSNGHPVGWPSHAHRYPSLCGCIALAGLPAGAVELPTGFPTRFARLGLV